ncbi:hypothetical protein J7M07_06185, partial [bacterium]|nr:hypothetical protein [bacterium]
MKKMLITVVAVVILMATIVSAQATIKTLAVTQVWQHKDTNMWCNVCGAGVIHPVHSPGCSHCDMYCAPASIAMYAIFSGRGGNFIQQDYIYDNGKSSQGEILGNGILETHGVGMYAGVASKAPEIQTGFTYSVGMVPYQFGPQGTANPAISCSMVEFYIDHNQIFLWIDIAGWPMDMTVPGELYYDSGHCKIIAGYDDNDTLEDDTDDLFYIYDPWPTSGSPSWVAQAAVLNNPNDMFLTTYSP